MSRAAQAIKQQLEARRRRALAPEYDPVRRDFELGLADEIEREAQALLTPPNPLKTGLGGEIVPQVEDGLPGLESVLQEPDLLDAAASKQRAHLLERAHALELGVQTAQDTRAEGAVQKMVSHQLAAVHSRAMTMLAESEASEFPEISIKKARAAARLVDAFSRAALVLQRLQGGGTQTIEVKYLQVNALVGHSGGAMENLQNLPTKNRGGRPPTSGDRTAKAIADRKADKQLLSNLKNMEDIG